MKLHVLFLVTQLLLLFSDTHWCNPQYRLVIHNTDEDDEKMCSFIVQLMQKDRRKMKHKGERLVYIGFIVYRVGSLVSKYKKESCIFYVGMCEYLKTSYDAVKGKL